VHARGASLASLACCALDVFVARQNRVVDGFHLAWDTVLGGTP